VEHLALAVADQERSRHFYESYFGFDAQPSRRYDEGVLMLYNAAGFALALGPTDEPMTLPTFFHFGIGLPSRDAVLAFRDRLVADGVPIAEEWDEPDYVSVKSALTRTATSWKPHGSRTSSPGAGEPG
jgi:catechol 2,3-dioxygenase-like lactoylglutathione lyase family enzyme